MFWIFNVLKGKDSRSEEKERHLSYFDLEWRYLENWYLDNHILR